MDTDADSDSDSVSPWDTDIDTLEWVTIEGGDFLMGNPEGVGLDSSRPRHLVSVQTFDIWRTEITTVLYQSCIDDGACEPTRDATFCNLPNVRMEHPINCINLYHATDVCEWLGGRLPSEAEWEYAARSGGQDITYAWGNEYPTCEHGNVDFEHEGCATSSTEPVCSYPLGYSDQGLCDLVGNVYEWVQDWMHPAYEYERDGVTYIAPDDGSAWDDPISPSNFKIMRGGGINSMSEDDPSLTFQATHRVFHELDWDYGGLGVRCVRETP